MGIMGSFLDSYFSLDVVTESPWGERTMKAQAPTELQQFYAGTLPLVVCLPTEGLAND
jgi:hypothetical protein